MAERLIQPSRAELMADWKYEVMNGDTLLGFDAWREQKESTTDG